MRNINERLKEKDKNFNEYVRQNSVNMAKLDGV
jgi:hypothetical protein